MPSARRPKANAEDETISNPAPEPISLAKIPKTGELIARELRKRIVRGELPEGATLPSEAELMAQLSVSRASLREALRILESEALLTVRRGSHGGPVVHRPDPSIAARYFGLVLQTEGTLLEDVYAARLLIEPPAVRLVVRNARGLPPASLLELIMEQQKLLDGGSVTGLGACIARFHDALIELSDNKTLLLVMKMLNILYAQHIEAIGPMGPSFDQLKASRLSLRAQGRLIEYITAHDEDGAVDYWRTHLLKVREYLFHPDQVQLLIDVV